MISSAGGDSRVDQRTATIGEKDRHDPSGPHDGPGRIAKRKHPVERKDREHGRAAPLCQVEGQPKRALPAMESKNHSDAQGLSEDETHRRRERHAHNERYFGQGKRMRTSLYP